MGSNSSEPGPLAMWKKMYVFTITDISGGDNALYEIQPMALGVLSDPHEALKAMPLHCFAEM